MAHPENGDRRPYFWNFIIYDSGVKYKYKKEEERWAKSY